MWGITPYYQVANNHEKNDSISGLEKDTAFFSIMEMTINIQKEISESLDERLEKANKELKRLERIEKQNKKEKKQLQEIEKMFNDFENRGL